MKIAITGHSAGIGQALSKIYNNQGHEIIGLSRRNGHNIRSIPKLASIIEPCDLFINNAQVGFAQTELLFEVWRKWQGLPKHIMVISTIMTALPTSPKDEWDEYWLQKRTLEEGCRQLQSKSDFPYITLVKPGSVATQPNQSTPEYADVTEWAETLVKCFDITNPNLRISEIALGPNYG
jgi:hypothetical protein